MSLVRKKPYTKQRIVNWTITLDKYGYVTCVTPKCPFMAFDCQEMAAHYGDCRKPMDPSLLFMCDVCEKGTTKKYLVQNHMIYSHPEEARQLGFTSYLVPATNEKKISKIIELSWQTLLECRGYIKCIQPFCHYLAEDLTEMRDHYRYCVDLYDPSRDYLRCSICKAQTDSEEKINRHIARCHPLGTTSSTPMNTVPLQMIDNWTKQIALTTYVKCETKNCEYMTDEIEDLMIHYRFCRNPNRYRYTICRICYAWLDPNKYNKHLTWHHGPTSNLLVVASKPEMICGGIMYDDEDLLINKSKRLKKYHSGKIRIIPVIPPFDIPSVKNINVKPNLRSLTKIEKSDHVEPLDIDVPKFFRKFIFLDNDGKLNNVPEKEANIKVRNIKHLKRKRKDLVCHTSNYNSKKLKPMADMSMGFNQQSNGVDSVLKRLGDEIMKQNQSGLRPFEIHVNDEIWTIDLPPFEVAEKIVKKEREFHNTKLIFQKSLMHSTVLLQRTNIISRVENSIKKSYDKIYPGTERILNPDDNPLLQKIHSLKKQPRPQPKIIPSQNNKQIDIDDPNEMANLLKKYSAEVSIQEEDDNVNRILGMDEDFGCEDECLMNFSDFDHLF